MKNKNGQIEDSVTTDESMKLTISCKKNVFDIEHLEFQYLENVPVLQDINLTIDHRPTAIIGQNGAGKTTLVKLLKGLLKPVSGSIYYGGSDMAEKTVAMLAGEIGYVFQNLDDQIFKYHVIDEDIADAFEECMDGWAQFLDTRTGEIVALSEDPYMACEEDQELWEEIDETDDYVRLPNQYELHEKSIMEKFAYEIGNQRVSEVLFDALRRRRPYRCFKDKINDLGISQIYYDYRNRTYINIAEEWCRNHHVPYRRKED